MINDLEVYKKHCERRGDDALTMKQFIYRLEDGVKIRTEDQLINTVPKGYYEKRYKKHCDLHGSNSVGRLAFWKRITQHNRDVDRAIQTPSRGETREFKMSLKKIWKRLIKEGKFNKKFPTFTGYIKNGSLDILKIATTEEIAGLKLYKQYKEKIFTH